MLSSTGGIVRRNLWIAPVVAMIALVIAALWVRTHIESAIKEQTASELTTLLRADVEGSRCGCGCSGIMPRS